MKTRNGPIGAVIAALLLIGALVGSVPASAVPNTQPPTAGTGDVAPLFEEVSLQNLDGRWEEFRIGDDHDLKHRWQNEYGWYSAWYSLHGWVSDIAGSRNRDGRLEIFGVGSDHAMWHIWQLTPGGSWSSWQSQEGWVRLVAAAPNADGRLEVFAAGSDNRVHHKWQVSPGGSWTRWTPLGSSPQVENDLWANPDSRRYMTSTSGTWTDLG